MLLSTDMKLSREVPDIEFGALLGILGPLQAEAVFSNDFSSTTDQHKFKTNDYFN
jgi:hypothetical protein